MSNVQEESLLFDMNYSVGFRSDPWCRASSICDAHACAHIICSVMWQVVFALVADGTTTKFAIQVESLLLFECCAVVGTNVVAMGLLLLVLHQKSYIHISPYILCMQISAARLAHS